MFILRELTYPWEYTPRFCALDGLLEDKKVLQPL